MVVCDKYSMDGPKEVLERCYPRQFLAESPLLVYAIASRARCTTMMMEAARQCLHEPTACMINTNLSILSPTSVASYQQVLQYHLDCRTAASLAVTNYSYSHDLHPMFLRVSDHAPCWFKCRSCDQSDYPISMRTKIASSNTVRSDVVCIW